MKRTLRCLLGWFCVALGLSLVGGVGRAQAPKAIKTPSGKTYFTGRKAIPPEVRKRLADQAHKRHGNLIQRLPKVTAAQFDSRTLGYIPPIRDQSQCGSCWDFSGSGVVGVALIKAGQIPNTANQPSEQYTLDCGQNGGCGGDDNITVLQWAKATGLPLDQDYGRSYQASSGRCAYKSGMKLYKISDWGFCTGGGDGVANVDDIKKAIVAYGCVGLGIDAGVLGDGTGIVSGSGHSIDHDVIVVGWDDSKGRKGCWIMRNSWGTGWGQACGGIEGGYCYIEYGSGDIGTEACWAKADSVIPPNPWVVQTSLVLPVAPAAPVSVPCCGNQTQEQPKPSGFQKPEAKDTTYKATFTTTSDRNAGHFGSALFGISADLPQPLPAGTYNAVLTPTQAAGVGPAASLETAGGQKPDRASFPPACDCTTIYRDPESGRRWRYSTPEGDWQWLPEPVVAPSVQAPLPFFQPTFMPMMGGFRGGSC